MSQVQEFPPRNSSSPSSRQRSPERFHGLSSRSLQTRWSEGEGVRRRDRDEAEVTPPPFPCNSALLSRQSADPARRNRLGVSFRAPAVTLSESLISPILQK